MLPHRILEFSLGWRSSCHTELLCFPRGGVAVATHSSRVLLRVVSCYHAGSFCFPDDGVALAIPNLYVFPKVMLLVPHTGSVCLKAEAFTRRIFVFSLRPCICYHTESFCPP